MPAAVYPEEIDTSSREDRDQGVDRPLLNDEKVKSDNSEAKCSDENFENDEQFIEKTALLETSESPPDILKDRSEKVEKEEEDATEDADAASATMVVPPDGGWGWVVVAASFFCNFIVDGIIFCFGIFLPEIAKSFGETKPSVALVGSLLSGFYLLTGPFVSAIANRYGFRVVTILGSLIAAGGFALSSLATSVNFLYISYGVIGGIGFGMIYAPSIITVGFYFEKWRALATGVAVCGSGIGNFLLAPLSTILIKSYGWENALLLQSVIITLCVVCGVMFRPLKPVRVTVEKEPDDNDNKQKDGYSKGTNNLLMKIKMARDEDLRKAASINSLKAIKYPTAAEMLNITERPDSAATVTTKLSKSTQSLNLNNMIIGHNEDLSSQQKRLSAPDLKESKGNHISARLINEKLEKHLKGEASQSQDSVAVKPSQKKKHRTASESSSTITINRSRRGTVTECMIRSRRGTITQLDDSINRPMYRDDIFFSASLHRLPQYKSERDFMGYTLSVTRLPTKKDLEEEEEFHCCPEAVRRTIATMLDLSLLKSPSFVLLCVSGFLTMMGFFIPFMYLKDRGTDRGMGENESVWLLSVIGIANTIGRVLCGVLSSFPGVNALLINNIALTIGGIATIISGCSMTAAYQYSYSALFGLSIACFASLRSILIVDLLGLEKLTNAFGILLLFQGVAATIGAPLAGFVQEATSSYDASFYLSGALILASGILCYPLNSINQWEKKKRKEDEQEKSHVI